MALIPLGNNESRLGVHFHPVTDPSEEGDGLRGVGRYLDAPSPATIKLYSSSFLALSLSPSVLHTHTHVHTHTHPCRNRPCESTVPERGNQSRDEKAGARTSGYPDPPSPILDTQIHLIANPLVTPQAKNDYLPWRN